MTLYEKIQNILYEEKIGVNEFLELTRFSKGMYYSIKNGEKTELKPLHVKAITDAFPNSSFSESTKKSFLKEKGDTQNISNEIKQLSTLTEVGNFVATNFEEVRKSSEFFDLTVKNSNNEYVIKKLTENNIKFK